MPLWTLDGNCISTPPFCWFVEPVGSACIHSGQPVHTVTLTLYRLHTPSSSVSACLRTAGLYPLCVTGSSITASADIREGKNADCGRKLSAFSAPRERIVRQGGRFLTSSVLWIVFEDHLLAWYPTTLPFLPALLVWMVDCRFDGAEQARLIEGLRPGGICRAAERERASVRGYDCPLPCDCEWTALHPWFSAVSLSHLWKKMADRAEMFSLSTFHSLSPPGCR